MVKDGLVRVALVTEEGVAHDGGGANADALRNGTTKNGAGGDATLSDGQTFRGYGAGSVVTFQFAGVHDLTGIRTFAGHGDNREPGLLRDGRVCRQADEICEARNRRGAL